MCGNPHESLDSQGSQENPKQPMSSRQTSGKYTEFGKYGEYCNFGTYGKYGLHVWGSSAHENLQESMSRHSRDPLGAGPAPGRWPRPRQSPDGCLHVLVISRSPWTVDSCFGRWRFLGMLQPSPGYMAMGSNEF